MYKYTRLLSLGLSAALISFTACGGDDDDKNTPTGGSTEQGGITTETLTGVSACTAEETLNSKKVHGIVISGKLKDGHDAGMAISDQAGAAVAGLTLPAGYTWAGAATDPGDTVSALEQQAIESAKPTGTVEKVGAGADLTAIKVNVTVAHGKTQWVFKADKLDLKPCKEPETPANQLVDVTACLDTSASSGGHTINAVVVRGTIKGKTDACVLMAFSDNSTGQANGPTLPAAQVWGGVIDETPGGSVCASGYSDLQQTIALDDDYANSATGTITKLNSDAGIKSIKVDVTATIKGTPDETWVLKADQLDATAKCN